MSIDIGPHLALEEETERLSLAPLPERYSRLLSAIIFKDNTKQEVLLARQRQVDASTHYVGQIILPTMTLSRGEAERMSGMSDIRSVDQPGYTLPTRLGYGERPDNPLTQLLEDLAMRRLGVSGDALEQHTFQAHAELVGRQPLQQAHDWKMASVGNVQLFNTAVIIEQGAEQIPERTASYDLFWESVDTVREWRRDRALYSANASAGTRVPTYGAVCMGTAIEYVDLVAQRDTPYSADAMLQ